MWGKIKVRTHQEICELPNDSGGIIGQLTAKTAKPGVARPSPALFSRRGCAEHPLASFEDVLEASQGVIVNKEYLITMNRPAIHCMDGNPAFRILSYST